MDNRRSASPLGGKGRRQAGLEMRPWDAGHDSRAAAEGEFYGRTTAFRPAMITGHAPIDYQVRASSKDSERGPNRK